MATQADKIQALEDELKNLNDTLIHYGELFNADGFIDCDEQKQLNSMQAVIKKIEARLTKIKAKKKTPTTKPVEEFEKALSKVENEVNQLLSQLGILS